MSMKHNARAIRRHHRERIIQKTMHRSYIQTTTQGTYRSQYELRDAAVRIYDNMAICSCCVCCNLRRDKWVNNISRLTINERRNLDSFKDQMVDINRYY